MKKFQKNIKQSNTTRRSMPTFYKLFKLIRKYSPDLLVIIGLTMFFKEQAMSILLISIGVDIIIRKLIKKRIDKAYWEKFWEVK